MKLLWCLLTWLCFGLPVYPQFTDDSDEDKSQGGKIVNGDLADIADFPFQVGLGTKKTRFFCGGAIVSAKIVFSAAHCTTITPTKFPRKGLRVFAGADRVDDPNAKFYEVKKVYVHPKWSYFRLNNDFSILVLKKELEFGKHIKPIPITRQEYPPGEQVQISGYGRDRFGVITGALRTASMTIAPRQTCQKSVGRQLRITKAMICLENKDDKASACHGDSGGPLVVDGFLLGVASFVTGSCKNGQTVYANIYHFHDFIEECGFTGLLK